MQLALGALVESRGRPLATDVSPKGMGIVVGVAGTLWYAGRILVVRWHGTKAPVAVV